MDPAIMNCQNSKPSWVGCDTDISVWNSGVCATVLNFGEASVAIVGGGRGEWYWVKRGLKDGRVNNWGMGIAFGLNRNGLSPYKNYLGREF